MTDQQPHFRAPPSRYHYLQQAPKILEELSVQLHLPPLVLLHVTTRGPSPSPTLCLSQTRHLLLIDSIPYAVYQGYKECKIYGSGYIFAVL